MSRPTSASRSRSGARQSFALQHPWITAGLALTALGTVARVVELLVVRPPSEPSPDPAPAPAPRSPPKGA